MTIMQKTSNTMRQPPGTSRPPDVQPSPARRMNRLPKLLSFLAVNALTGAAIGFLVVSGILASNIMGLRDLIVTTSDPLSALITIFGMFMLTFASLAMGTAVMLLPWSIHRGNPFGGNKRKRQR